MAIQEIFVHPDCPDCTGVIAEYNDSPNSFGDAVPGSPGTAARPTN